MNHEVRTYLVRYLIERAYYRLDVKLKRLQAIARMRESEHLY